MSSTGGVGGGQKPGFSQTGPSEVADDMAGLAAKQKGDREAKQGEAKDAGKTKIKGQIERVEKFLDAQKDKSTKDATKGKEESLQKATETDTSPKSPGKNLQMAASETKQLAQELKKFAGSFGDFADDQLVALKKANQRLQEDIKKASADQASKKRSEEAGKKVTQAKKTSEEEDKETLLVKSAPLTSGLSPNLDGTEELADILEKLQSGGSVDEAKLVDFLQCLAAELMQEGKALEVELAETLSEVEQALRRLHGKIRAHLSYVLDEQPRLPKEGRYRLFATFFSHADEWPPTIPPGKACTGSQAWSENQWDAFFGWLKPAPCPIPSTIHNDTQLLVTLSPKANSSS
ncbi:MAG: hypothetical protein VYA34_02305 [Myxococcota bacterium]|nr:hypothetical protein [Myxococcota bacterium]